MSMQEPDQSRLVDWFPPETPDKIYPLSFNQQSLWFLQQLMPAAKSYHVVATVKARHDLDLDALRCAFRNLAARHGALRTTFSARDGKPIQRVHRQINIAFSVEDAQGWDEARIDARVAAEHAAPFDLEHGPLWRVTLLRQSVQEYLVILCLHHIITDMWSMAILLAEIPQLYVAEMRKTPANLKAPRMTYVDYVRAQKDMIEGPEGDRHWAYWQAQLQGDLPLLQLPTDRSRPPILTGAGASETIIVDVELATRLRVLAKAHAVSLHALVLATFDVLLHRYSGQDEILVGYNVAGRTASTARTVGYFVNQVVVRGRMAGDPVFCDFLSQIHQAIEANSKHSDYPFAKVVEKLHPDRDLSQSPLFRILFSWQKTTQMADPTGMSRAAAGIDDAQMEIAGLLLEEISAPVQSIQFDLSLTMAEAGDELVGSLAYSTDLFDQSTCQRMVDHLLVLLRSIADNPVRPISRLDLLGATERQLLLHTWNKTVAPYASGQCIHELVTAQAQRTPDAVAVSFAGEKLTYAELDRRANIVAYQLNRLGIQPDTPVGVFMGRSSNALVALLGILKSGGACLPLDATYPQKRNEFILNDSNAPVVITEQHLASRLAVQRIQTLCLDTLDWQDTHPMTDRLPGLTPRNLAYVIYTSGSTGTPKGVAMPHQALVNLAMWQQENWTLPASARTAQFAALSFDVAFQEIFATLIAGGCSIIVPEETRRNPTELRRFLLDESIERLFLPFVALQQLAEEIETNPDGSLPDTLRDVITAGEQLRITPEIANLFSKLPGCVLHNHYGPTETHVITAHKLTGNPHDWPALPPIGRPIANTQVYLLDAHGQPVPIGVAGELFGGGDCLARGYLNRHDLTADRFVPAVIDGQQIERLYRTGDLARYRPDGTIEFLGRIDQQVKVRGARVELGEIEAALTNHPAIHEAAVAAHINQQGKIYLVAYVVSSPDVTPSMAELREFLSTVLPDYMLPATFVRLSSLPLTPSGKVDRQALQPTGGTLLTDAQVSDAPQSPIEIVVAEILADILGVRRVGINDDFFELGGHSLLATQVVSRLRSTFAIDISLMQLFETPTVAALARHIERALQTARGLDVPPVGPAPRNVDLPLSFSQERMWVVQQIQPETSAYNIPVALRLTGILDVATLEQALNELVRRHEILRTTIVLHDGHPRQHIGAAKPVTVVHSDLSGFSSAEAEERMFALCQADAMAPFDLAAGPLLRAILVRLGEHEHVLQVTMHHVIADAWALSVAARELSELYAAYASGQPSPLPEPTLQYADYAYWQRAWLQGPVLEAQLDYWRRQLADVPVLSLPTDRPRPAIQSSHGAQLSMPLNETLLDRLRTLGHAENATLFMTLLAAFDVLLQRYSGQSDVAVGVPIANRHWLDSEHLLGTLVNTLVLRTQISGQLTFRELLRQVRNDALKAYANQDLPFEQLVTALSSKRDLSHTPLFQVLFDFTNVPGGNLGLPGLSWQPLNIDRGSAQFDLTLAIVDTDYLQQMTVEYNTDLFDASTIERMFTHYLHLLDQIVTDPDLPISRLELLTAAEKHQMVVSWNDTAADYPRHACLHQLFQAKAQATPDAVAVSFGGQRLTYRQLERQANLLAERLLHLGVGPNVLVGICMPRSLESVVALLGVLTAGGAYVPLDAKFPEERLRYMVEDAHMAVILTSSTQPLVQRLLHGMSEATPQVIEVNIDDAAAMGLTGELRASDVRADNLAYVIYTSGSTGRPKGVEISHQAIVNFLLSMKERPGLTNEAVMLSVTTLSFDIAALEIFLPLITGAQVVLASDEVARDGYGLARLLDASKATIMQATPVTWQMLIAAGWQGNQALTILCGGEALSPELARQLVARGRAVWNMYGPTETTVWSTISHIAGSDQPITIGRPINNTQVYIVDQQSQPVPIGVTGELLIGGDGVARGYRNQPTLTNDRFTANPFVPTAGARLFRTGDLARFLPDGQIEHLGRGDHQVKIRGFRVELGEIEASLAHHPLVHQAAATTRLEPTGNPQLVAYVVLKQPSHKNPATANDLRRFLQGLLPDYMVPSNLLFLDKLPLTPNHKVDRRALSALPVAQTRDGHEWIAPRSDVEVRLQAMWEELLAVRPIGIRDDFFNLGGHSLLAVRLFSQIEADFGVRLPLSVLFQGATIEQLASAIDADASRNEVRSCVVALQPEGNNLPLFCVHGITGDILWFAELARYMALDQPLYGLEAMQQLDEQTDSCDIASLAAHYIRDIRRIQPYGPYCLAGASFGGTVALEMAQQLHSQGEEIGLLAIFDHEPPNVRSEMRTPLVARRLGPSMQFLRNLPPWLANLRSYTRQQIQDRSMRYVFVAHGWLKSSLSRHKTSPSATSASALIDYADQLPEHRRRQIEAHYRALQDYRPLAYPGKVTLFKASVRPLVGIQNPETSWRALASGGVDVTIIPGTHEGMFRGEGAAILADALRKRVMQVPSRSHVHSSTNALSSPAMKRTAAPASDPARQKLCDLSIVIVNWNTRDVVCECLRSIDAAAPAVTLETWVVDNASVDGSVAALRQEFPHVKLIANAGNVGFARANNQAIEQARGRHVLLLNSDTLVTPGALDAMVQFLDDHPTTGVVGPLTLNPDGSLQVSCFPAPTLVREFWFLFHLDEIYPYGIYNMKRWNKSAPREVDAVLGACLMARREVLDQVGLLDEQFFMYSEEIDLCGRVRQAGWRVHWLPKAAIIHFGGQSTRQVASNMFIQLYRSKVIYFRKNHGPASAAVYKLILGLAAAIRVGMTPLTVLEPAQKRADDLRLARNYGRLLARLPGM